MNKQPTYSDSESALETLTSEMILNILEEEISDPWDLNSWESDAYLSELEEDFALCDCLDSDELASGTERLFSHFNECWSNTDSSEVKQSLWKRFGQFVPSSQLDKITAQAQNIISLNLSPIEQLIQCVKPLLNHWSEDDLQIFARPLIYAMRGSSEFKQAPWDELSEIDQVRLTMKIAHEAITQLQRQNSQTISGFDG
ncbi:conserved hypothetical protein [Gloeothece citriformis PCC 7424]|uniref:Uncharacterized protein n=1 Tax=Gloeothece citriformis (strain PCC 7424) TaxID=65393 RepID=B7KF39_GLOC7|nr:hypothetical protein [Gloeothece citriformis]ACK70495.1 conserved hypothetical protein [Gloeothece citriformis PCC 7424]